MQLQRRLVRLPATVAIALCASLLFASTTSAKVVEYTAPVGTGFGSSIDFKLKLKKNKQKFQPVAIKKLSFSFEILDCPDGDQWGSEFPDLIPVSDRRFSLSDTGGGTTLKFSGRVPRNGPPRGKIRYSFPSQDSPNPQRRCDTGTRSWTVSPWPQGPLPALLRRFP